MHVDLIAEADFGEDHLLYDFMEIALFDFCHLLLLPITLR